jgi:hypothetical protein
MPAIHLSGNCNLTYVQIPKTAGTSVGHWIKANAGDSVCTEWYDHPTPSTILSSTQKNFSFTIVRNPWERIVSLYFFLKNWESPHPQYKDVTEFRSMLYSMNNYTEFPSFDSWLRNSEQFVFLPWIWWKLNTPQTTWTDVDLIIKYENLNTEFQVIRDMLNCNDPLPNQTVTKGIHWQDYRNHYTDETKKIVADMFAEEIELWKYLF